MAYSDVIIANQALALVPAESIQSFAEKSLSARECKRSYRIVIDELLELHPWIFAGKREALAQIGNDRASEWGFAYALPPGAVPERISWASTTGGNAYVPLVGQTLAATAYLADADAGYPFALVGSTLYTNAPGALLDARDTTVTEASFSPLFARAVIVELAKRIVLPITKNGARYRELVAEARAALDEAIVANLNRSPQTYLTRIPDNLAARA